MSRRSWLCVITLAILILPTSAIARELALRAECFSDTGDETIVRVYEILDITTQLRHFSGVISFANGEQIQKTPLRLLEAGPNAVWRGVGFLLRVHTDKAVGSDLFLGRFRGRGDDGEPIILRSLSCDLSGWASSVP